MLRNIYYGPEATLFCDDYQLQCLWAKAGGELGRGHANRTCVRWLTRFSREINDLQSRPL